VARPETGALALSDATRLAVDRTRLAHERTMMAWVRTATSLISFGFTIYKSFQYLADSRDISLEDRLIGPRGFALIMISIGIGALVIATIDHRRNMRAIDESYGRGTRTRSLSLMVAAFIGTLGVLGLLLVIFQQ
jgi:putative membrane protein